MATKKQRKYDMEFKIQAVKLGKEIGVQRAAKELGIPAHTIYNWNKQVKDGSLDIGEGAHSPSNARTLNAEMIELRKRIKALEKDNKRLQEENEFLAEASAFFAASRRKSPKTKE
ncbi:transposase [Eubacterium xylanophilum]|uniref:transposase n=6 Tax=Eubacterium xylanophilum TaxID=39497 RepID=UPI00047C5D00|nr:transposase [Eubacterium xylanophilum]